MKTSALRLLLLMFLCKVALGITSGHNYYVSKKMNWSSARNYCREHYTDLSSIKNQDENDAFINSSLSSGHGNDTWIGLYKDSNGTWKWSGGTEASFFNWDPKNTTNGGCAVFNQTGWHQKNCENKFPFFCFQSNLLLVKENKTWEEALEHCHSQDMELVSLLSDSAVAQTLQISTEAQADLVWTSLRYLADTWLWVDGFLAEDKTKSKIEMPQCPTWTHRCGALSLDAQHLDSWDCADSLNFVCYSGH